MGAIAELTILDATDSRRWEQWVQNVPTADAYYLHGYVTLAHVLQEGEARLAVLRTPTGTVIYPFISRRLTGLPFAPAVATIEQYSDITSPYGYGGPMVHVHQPGDDSVLDCLARQFDQQFGQWCRDNGVVSEFVRFHPLATNACTFGLLYRAELDRNTVYIDLTAGPEGVWSGLNRGSRSNVNRARRNGLAVTVTNGEDLSVSDVAGFMELYRHTMDRNEASAYYYFGEDYFRALFQRLGSRAALIRVRCGDDTVAAAILLAYGRWLHYHLGASHTASLSLRPNDLLFYEAAKWGADRGFEALHLGGGRTAAPGDSLLRFKASFSPKRAEFYTAGRVHLPDLYALLEHAWRRHTAQEPSVSYFPSYRK